MLVPLLVLFSLKVFSYLFLAIEDCVASKQVNREAKRLLNEAEKAEKRRIARDRGEESSLEVQNESADSVGGDKKPSFLRMFARRAKTNTVAVAPTPSQSA